MPSSQPGLIVSVSGIRGVVGESLTPETAVAFARAFGTYVDGKPVAVSRDSRPSGEMLHEAVAAGLMSAGCDVYHLSIAATPTVGVALRVMEAAGAIQVTASHNPSEYNGLKLFGPRGMVLTAAEGREVLRFYHAKQYRPTNWHSTGVARTVMCNPSREHVTRILNQVDHAAISNRKFRVLLDANHGAGGPLALMLLTTLGCHPVREGCEPDGRFAHGPEPTATNVTEIAGKVREEHCALGMVLDPDADRLALIDETGRYIGEELTLALAAVFRLRQQQGPVVVNMSTTRLIEDLANAHGCPFYRAPVGEANVATKMLEVGAVLGGEGNGGVIDPRVGLVRDPFIGVAMILNLLTETGRRLSELVAELPQYQIIKDKYEIDPDHLPKLYDRLEGRWSASKLNREDGLRLDWEHSWVHVRPSNTEPIVRVIAEAREAEAAQQLCREVGEVIAELGKPTPKAAPKPRPKKAPVPKSKPAKAKKGKVKAKRKVTARRR